MKAPRASLAGLACLPLLVSGASALDPGAGTGGAAFMKMGMGANRAMALGQSIVALAEGEGSVQDMVAEYDRRRKLIVGGLNTLGLDCFEPRGAFYAFPSIARSGMDENDFAERLLGEEQVAVVPGSAFGESGRGFVRMAYATAYEKIEEALNRIERFMRRHG